METMNLFNLNSIFNRASDLSWQDFLSYTKTVSVLIEGNFLS